MRLLDWLPTNRRRRDRAPPDPQGEEGQPGEWGHLTVQQHGLALLRHVRLNGAPRGARTLAEWETVYLALCQQTGFKPAEPDVVVAMAMLQRAHKIELLSEKEQFAAGFFDEAIAAYHHAQDAEADDGALSAPSAMFTDDELAESVTTPDPAHVAALVVSRLQESGRVGIVPAGDLKRLHRALCAEHGWPATGWQSVARNLPFDRVRHRIGGRLVRGYTVPRHKPRLVTSRDA